MSPLILLLIEKVLNVVIRYNNKNSIAFDLENKRLFFPFNSNVSLVHSSDNGIYFKYNYKKYFAKKTKRKIFKFLKMWALERGLDISISRCCKVSFSLQKSGSFF
ncbi:hypothetical protein NWP96_07700 [Mycoplasmopsis cynos]|nr:hypothetical protein [Mycoplasmopsis cynos]